MPTAATDGVELYYEAAGSGETVAFVGEAGYGAWQWGFLAPELTGPRETLVWDLRGTGRSDAPPGPYSVDDLAGDLEAVLAAHGARRVHLVGAGLGGAVALRYARSAGRVRSLTLFGTPREGNDVAEGPLRALGPRPETEAACRTSLEGALSPSFRTAREDLLADICGWRREEDAEEPAFDAQVAALLEFASGPAYEMDLPTLVFHGVEDPVVPARIGEELAADLPHGEYVPVEGRRLPYVEQARAIADRWVAFREALD